MLSTSTLYAQLDVKVIQASTSIITTAFESTQLEDPSGNVIGEPIIKELDPTKKVGPKSLVFSIVTEASNIEYEIEDAQRNIVEPSESVDGKTLFLNLPGKYWWTVRAIDFPKNIYSTKKGTATLERVTPAPTPTPSPTPSPIGPSPIEGAGLRVLFISESGERMPKNVEESFYSPEITTYLNANCIKVEGQPDFRRVDPDTQFTDPNHRFAKALARPRTTTPWLIISNGVSGYEGPFPETKTATLELLRSFTPLQSKAIQPTVIMYSSSRCPSCNKFKLFDKDRLLGVIYEEVDDITNVYQSHPTFVLKKYNTIVVLSGYQTAETIITTLNGITK